MTLVVAGEVGEDGRVEGVTAAAFGLFGREDELTEVSDVLAHGGSALVTGEAGVGKSSLLTVADQLAQRRGRRVLSVTPTPFDRGLPFAGLAELVAQCPEGADSGLPAPQRRALAVALQRAEPEGDVDPLAVPLAVRSLLTGLAESEPVAVIIDDLQWLDQASAGSLGFALRRLTVDPQRLSVLVGTRPEPDAGTDLVRGLPEPRHELSMAPLEDWAIGQLLRTRLGPRWTPPVSAPVARASGGNPLLALMIAQAMQSDVSAWHASTPEGRDPVFPVPPSLAGLLGEKVTLLPRESRGVLLLVSAAGRLTVAQLNELVDPTMVEAALEAAADQDVARIGPGSLVVFTHPMLASAIYDAATPAERRQAHTVLADMLDDPVERALHRSRSATAPDEAVARQLEQAADASRARGAQQLAGELLEAAALATPAATGSTGSYRRWLGATDTYLGAGDVPAAQAALDQVAALASDPEQRADVLMRRITMSNDVTQCRSFAEEALRLSPTGSPIRAQALQVLGTIHRLLGQGPEALQVSQQAAVESAASDRSDIRLRALNERLAIERHWGVDDSHQTMRDIEELAQSLAMDPDSASLAWTRSFYSCWDDASAEEHARRGIAHAVEAGRYGDLSSLYISLILVLIRGSQVREARTALAEADRSGAWALGSGPQERMARILVHVYEGRLDAAREIAQHAVADPQLRDSTYWRGGFLAQLGLIETSAGEWQAALVHLRELADIFASTEMVDLEQLLWGVDYADAALQVGALDEMGIAIEILRRQGAAGLPEAGAAADRCEALRTAAGGDVDTALHDLVDVVDRQGAECPFEAARSRLALGQVYRRAGYKGLANQTLTEAAEAFEALAIPRWAERARDEAGRVGLHPTTTTLTETERRVAELVGSGHSNHETAAALFISVKTVEANLTRIYRKLSVRSRAELAHTMTLRDGVTRHD